ncbi:MAG: serine/threonine-protein phosphatase [Pseudolabrys sp.]|nr:serine/threonine-protein phosphatase [Pseudolabrys sp.]
MTTVAHISAFTHRGRVRARNEDTVVVGDWISPPHMAEPRAARLSLSAPVVCAVADGLGGHRAGEVASRRAAEQLAAASPGLTSADSVAACLGRINDALHRAMADDPACAGMGTTIVGVVLGARMIWFNIGDSRLYQFHAGELTQVSIDDTPAGPRTGILTQCLGGTTFGRPVRPHVGGLPAAARSRLLLCSDGLTDMLDDDDIADCLALPPTDAVAELFDLAMRAGGVDNVSIIVVSLDERA